ncbi:hypothetical protein [Ruegeria sp.]
MADQKQKQFVKVDKSKKKKKKKGLFSRVLDEAWDAIEDVFD